MAKKTVAQPPMPQEDELTVTVFRFRGSSESMQKGFEAFGAALGAALGTAAPPARALNGNTRRTPQQLGAGTGAAEDAIDTEAADTEEAADDAIEPEQPAAPAATKAPAKPRKFEFISTISDNAATPLKDFVAQYGPTEINDRYLVACLWLQTVAGFEVYTADHVWTCFRMLDGWKILADFTQPMRLMKSKKSYFDTPKKGQWKLNPHGLTTAQAIKPAA